MALDESVTDVETETGPVALAGEERFESAGAIFLAETRAAVAHDEPGPRARGVLRVRRYDPQLDDASRGRGLDGVLDQVHQHLPDHLLVLRQPVAHSPVEGL